MSVTSDHKYSPMRLFRDDTPKEDRDKLYRDIWRLAWPAFLGQGLNACVMLFSRMIVSQLGEKAYNSVSIGMMIFFIIITIIAAVGVGTVALVAQNWGAGNRKRAGEILQQSLIFGFMLCVGMSIIGIPLSRFLYQSIGADEETVREGPRFLFWLIVAIPIIAPGFFFSSALRGAGDTKTPMVAGVIMGFLSLFLSYGLILGKLGMPKLGILGAAFAIDGSFFAFSMILFTLFATNSTILKLPTRGWRPDWRTGSSILRIGIPSAMEWILIQLGLLIYIAVVYKYGDYAVAGYLTGFALLGFAQTPAFGFQTAATTLVGQSVGAGDHRRAESAFRHCAMLAFVFMAVLGVIIYFAVTPGVISFFFRKLDPESIAHARTWTKLMAMVMPLMGIAFTLGGGLRGAGDTVSPLIASIAGVYGGRILMAYGMYYLVPVLAMIGLTAWAPEFFVGGFFPGLTVPVAVVWLSMFPDLILRIGVVALRLRSGKWKAERIGKK